MGMSHNARLRVQIFVSLYLSYMFFVYVRKSFSFVIPTIVTAEAWDKEQLGLITSSQALAYALSKFFGGFLADLYSPTLLLCAGLCLTGLMSLVFIGLDWIPLLAFIWFLNGAVQGPAWACCAKMLKTWFPADQLGTWWSILSTSMNVAGTVGPLLATVITMNWGWRISMLVPGVLSMVLSGIFMFTLQDHPTAADLEKYNYSNTNTDKKNDDAQQNGQPVSQNAPEDKNSQSILNIYDILIDPFFVHLSMAYLFTFMIRSALLDWGQLYLVEEKGHSKIIGSVFVSSQEVGGIVGSITAGYLSDQMITKKSKAVSPGNERLKVALFCLIIVVTCMGIFVHVVTPESSQVFISCVRFGLGFGLYGPISLYGVAAMEAAPSHLAGSAHSVVGVYANVGAVLAGLPLSLLAKTYNWAGTFLMLECVAVLSVFTVLSAMYVKQKLTPFTRHKQS